MQHVAVIKGVNCAKIMTVFLQMLHSTVIVRLNCRSSAISVLLFTVVHRLCFKFTIK